MGISWAFSSRKPFLHEQRVLCSYCWQMACSFRFEHCWLYVQDSKRFLAEKKGIKWGGLATLVKRRPSRSDVFHFEQTSNCLDNLVTFSALFSFIIFSGWSTTISNFFPSKDKGSVPIFWRKNMAFLGLFLEADLGLHITSMVRPHYVRLSISFLHDVYEGWWWASFWDLGFII